MHFFQSPDFRGDVERYRLVFSCEDCLHFRLRGSHDEGACAVLYPTSQHRLRVFKEAPDGARLYFCKMFEPA